MTQGRGIKWQSAAAYAAASLGFALYFFQSSTLAPNHTDEGLLLQYIDVMAKGQRPFYDFVDAYGILNWLFPVAFYKLFGNTVWGVRMWMVILKVITVWTAYFLVRRLSSAPGTPVRDGRGTFYSIVASLFAMVLVGAQWQSLQTPYAFITVMPLTMGAWYYILCAPLGKPNDNVFAAGLLTAAAIWTKLNTGMYLLAGGLFVYFFWIPVEGPADAPPWAKRLTKPMFLRLRFAGALGYAAMFTVYIREHYNVWFFLYLTLPLMMVLGWTLLVTIRGAPDALRPLDYLRPWLRYLGTTLGLAVALLVAYYGKRTGQYLRELSGILSTIHYTAPFPPLGKAGHYIGLNEYYWLQIPWLVTALFAVWCFVAERRGPSTFGEEWPRRRAQTSGLFLLFILHSFVMYARCDETHIYQMLVLSLPVLFILIAQLDAFLSNWHATAYFPLRLAIVGFGFFFCLSLLVVPTAKAFRIGPGDWINPKLAHLRYREKFSPYIKDTTSDVFDHDWDIAEDEAADYVRSISLPNEDVLMLTANRLLHLNSNTRPIGGRYHFFFYLVNVGLLDREGFDKLVPRELVQDIVTRPPRVIISSIGTVPLQDAFPEFRWLRDTFYVKTRGFRHILVYELRLDGEPVQAPLR